jgi:hypothetical protein
MSGLRIRGARFATKLNLTSHRSSSILWAARDAYMARGDSGLYGQGEGMHLDKAYGYIEQFPWLESYFEKVQDATHGSLVRMLRDITRYIAVRPIESLDLDTTETCNYAISIPKPQVGAKKPVDAMAFHLTSPRVVRFDGPEGKTEECSVATEDYLQYSGAATLCFDFWTHPAKYLFEYLPSTHSMRDAITATCERYGHLHRPEGYSFDVDLLRPKAIVVSRLIYSSTHAEILRRFDIYAAPHPDMWGMSHLCKGKHK